MKTEMRIACCLLTAAVASSACGGDDAHEPADPAQLACDETDEAGTEIAASTARDETAPEIEIGAEPYAVALSASDRTYVRIEADEDTEAILLLGAEHVVTALYHEDAEEEIASAGANASCPDEIPEHYDLELHEPGTYFIELAPSAVDSVWLLLSGAAGHGHSDED